MPCKAKIKCFSVAHSEYTVYVIAAIERLVTSACTSGARDPMDINEKAVQQLVESLVHGARQIMRQYRTGHCYCTSGGM